MENKHILRAIIVLVLIIAGMFVFAYIKRTELAQPELNPVSKTTQESPYNNITRIDAKHFFFEPTHTIVGEIVMPTPCDLLNWDTRIQESSPETVIIDFDVVNHSETCAQIVTAQRFKITFDAHKDATIRATFEGRAVDLNLIPASSGESPDEYELFIKG